MKIVLIAILCLVVVGGVVYALTSTQSYETDGEGIVCTMDAKLCPDGSYVGRTGPDCQFAACPDGNATSTATSTGATTRAAGARQADAATIELAPASTVSLPTSASVAYTGLGFSPREAMVALGGKVTFTNKSSSNLWVASDPHPTHNGYPGFDQGRSVPPGGSWTFTFEREGSWTYHNHIISTHRGTVVAR
ncbi:MAG: hypothetical protein HZA81_02840 [Candidatus Taylorbacteria bacterium]|nr:hypothetical protein [Candidatus Taylorbacteria bacterium]